MEDWQKEFWTILETVSVEVEQFLEDISNDVEEVAQQVQELFTTEIEEFFQALFESVIEIQIEEEVIFSEHREEESEIWLNPPLEPTQEFQPACRGCHHYHGRVYNGTLLVCGMHPYGWDEKICPDWSAN